MYECACICALKSNCRTQLITISFCVFSESKYEDLSRNDENFWRVKLILHRDVLEKLRGCFRSAFQAKYRFAWGDNSTSGNFFMENVPVSEKPHQFITSTVEQGNTGRFDRDALYYCLLDSGTDLLESETRTSVERLHAQSKALDDAISTNLPDDDFRARLQEIRDVYRTLQWDHTRLDAVTQGRLSTDDYDGLKQEKVDKSVRSKSFYLF